MPLCTFQAPDSRLLGRLCRLIRHDRVGSRAYVVGGEALGAVILSGTASSESALQLADAMIGEIMLVEAATADCEDADTRARLAMATAMISVLRPHVAAQADASISVWLGCGIGSPRRMHDPEAIFGRALLAMRIGNLDDAVACLDVLFERFPTFEGVGVLQDWLVARIGGHGGDRETGCVENLAFVLRDHPQLVVLAAMVAEIAAPREQVIERVERRLAARSVVPVARRA
jgi:hypothetical protein